MGIRLHGKIDDSNQDYKHSSIISSMTLDKCRNLLPHVRRLTVIAIPLYHIELLPMQSHFHHYVMYPMALDFFNMI
jgi:hypothetical protein